MKVRSMTLAEFARFSIGVLATTKDFPEDFVLLRMIACRKYHGGLTTSTIHGIDYFQNVLDYIDKPDDWLKQFNGKPELEKNFVEILKRNV